jgi:SNW domain-containing protein 1
MHAGADLMETEDERKEREERDVIREERKRERERDRRMELLGHKKSKLARDSDRDVSEKIALGEQPSSTTSEIQYDSRLFSQSQGMDSGFAHDDTYNVYDKPLFKGTSASMLYRPKKNEDTDVYGDSTSVEKILNTSRFKPDKDFDGVDRTKTDSRQTPVEFEKDKPREEEDPFGLDEFLKEAKTGGKKLDKIGKTGHLHAGSTGGGRR